MMNRYIYFLLIVMLCLSCSSIVEPDFKRVEKVDVRSMSMDNIDVNAEMIFENPNDFSLAVSDLEIVAIVDKVEMGKVTQSSDAEMPASGEFGIPINIKMNLNEAYDGNSMAAIAKGLEIMNARKVTLNLKGSLKVGKGGVSIPVPINEVTEVSF